MTTSAMTIEHRVTFRAERKSRSADFLRVTEMILALVIILTIVPIRVAFRFITRSGSTFIVQATVGYFTLIITIAVLGRDEAQEKRH